MLTLKEYTHRIKSLRNTRKMTKTMKMVAATRLRHAQQAQEGARLYSSADRRTDGSVRLVAAMRSAIRSSRPARRRSARWSCLFSSDRGLCGAFNNQIAKKLISWIRENAGRFERIDVSFCGRRGYNCAEEPREGPPPLRGRHATSLPTPTRAGSARN